MYKKTGTSFASVLQYTATLNNHKLVLSPRTTRVNGFMPLLSVCSSFINLHNLTQTTAFIQCKLYKPINYLHSHCIWPISGINTFHC